MHLYPITNAHEMDWLVSPAGNASEQEHARAKHAALHLADHSLCTIAVKNPSLTPQIIHW